MTREEILSQSEALEQFWGFLKDRTTVMLGFADEHQAQPMTAITEDDDGLIWFFTRDDTDFAQRIGDGAEGRLIFVSGDQKGFADITGELTIANDPERVKRFWNPAVAAWYPDGQDDPHLRLLRFAPTTGQVWISKHGLLRFAFEVARANLTKTQPDMGARGKVNFTH